MRSKAQRRVLAAMAAILGLGAGLTGCQGPAGMLAPSGPAMPSQQLAPVTNTPVAGNVPANPPVNGPTVRGQMPGYRTTQVTTFSTPAPNGYPAGPQYATPVSMQNGEQLGMPAEAGPSPRVQAMPNQGAPGQVVEVVDGPMGAGGFCPRELTPVSLPPYTIAPPDILYLNALRLIPKPPYRLEPLEVLLINVTDTLPGQPIGPQVIVTPEGMINLGFNYGSVRVGGMTLDEATLAIRTHLGRILRNPTVTLALMQFRGLQQVQGQHLIRPDGTISLGIYGSVYVSGLTIGQAKCVIEKYLSQYLLDPQIAVDVAAYNSKVYFVIFDGGGFGQQVFRLPSTGNEHVLDAISLVQGLAPVSSKHRIWLSRPAPPGMGCSQILPVDWNAITQAGQTLTNYQVFPGDRIYVSANRLIAFDNYLSMVLNPINRVLGTTLLSAFTVNAVRSLTVPITNNGTGTGFVPVVGR